MSEKWDQRFLRQALVIADWSKDPSTKVGSIVVDPSRGIRSTGYNGFPRGVVDDIPGRMDKPFKYQLMVHAEENCILHAARVGIPLEGCTLYIASFPAKFGPCDRCCASIIQVGIKRVVAEPPAGDIDRWAESFQVGAMMLAEAGVTFNTVAL